MPIYNAGGTLVSNQHAVFGTGVQDQAGSPSLTVTLTGSAVFTSAGTYTCQAKDTAAATTPAITYNTGTSFKLAYGNGSNKGDTMSYWCFGY
jgi:hypothetical protein